MKATTALSKDGRQTCSCTHNKCIEGIIYIAKCCRYPADDIYKVGKTKSLETLPKRMKQIEREYGMEFALVAFYSPVRCATTFERWLHNVLRDYKVNIHANGKNREELFRLPGDVRIALSKFDQHLFMNQVLTMLFVVYD